MISKILIIYNPEKPEAVMESQLLKKYLMGKKKQVLICSTSSTKFPKTDLCITLGGDGTILKIAHRVVDFNVPVLGVNFGKMGFLAEFEQKEIFLVLGNILAGRYKVEKRTMLDVEIVGEKKHLLALNDCVVRSGASGRVILLNAKVNAQFVTKYLCDGLIVSTPTGTTAYSFSAGGPIVHPQTPVFVVTPLCPCNIVQRPLVVSSKENIVIEIPKYKSNKDIILSLDGQRNFVMKPGQRILINEAKEKFNLITKTEKSYFDVLRNKLKWD